MEQPQPRNPSSGTFAAQLAQNIVVLLDEIDQLRAENAQLRHEAALQAKQTDDHPPAVPEKRVPRVNGGAAA